MKTIVTFGSLFAGIGGFDLGFERAGMRCKWQVEIDDYANRVLAKHWPNVHRERDIRKCGSKNLMCVDVICGGFPCQDISYAGLGAGLDGERSGLFFEAIRVVRELQPRVVVLENVAALLARGVDRVLGSLAEIGFDAEWHCIPAAAFGAPHIRDRVFIIGRNDSDTNCNGRSQGRRNNRKEASSRWPSGSNAERLGGKVANATRRRRSTCGSDGHGNSEVTRCQGASESCGGGALSDSNVVRTQIPVTRRFATIAMPERSAWWESEPDVGRVANGVPKRVDRLRGLGNAVVPQVAEWIGLQVLEKIKESQ